MPQSPLNNIYTWVRHLRKKNRVSPSSMVVRGAELIPATLPPAPVQSAPAKKPEAEEEEE